MKKSSAVDHQAFVSEAIKRLYPSKDSILAKNVARYLGFEGTTSVSDPHAVLIGVVKNRLAPSSRRPDVLPQRCRQEANVRYRDSEVL